MIRHKNGKLGYFKIFVLLFAFIFTFIVRVNSYDRTPTSNHLDEQLYAWSGLYLIETGTPVSWSTLGYPKRAEVFKGKISYKGGAPEAFVTLYSPWLDEPPLFSLIVGYSAHLFGADRTQFVPSSYIRFPVVLMSFITSIFVFLIAMKIKGYWTGVLAVLVYGTVPVFVIGSRVAMPENFIGMLFVIMIYLLMKFFDKPDLRYILLIPILAGLAGLAKPTGYFLLPLALFFVIQKLYKNKINSQIIKYSSYLILGTLPFILVYIWYGNYYDPEIFKTIVSVQGHRPAGFASLVWYFISPSYGTTILKDSWYVFCLLFTFYFLFKPKEVFAKIFYISFVYWVIIIMLSAGEGDLLAWYRFPTFPFLAVSGAIGIQLLVKRSDFFSSFLVAGMLLGSRLLIVRSVNPNIQPTEYRTIFSALMMPSIANMILKKNFLRSLNRILIIMILAVGIFLNVKYVYNVENIDCEGISCPFVPSTFLSRMYLPFVWRYLKLPEIHEQ